MACSSSPERTASRGLTEDGLSGTPPSQPDIEAFATENQCRSGGRTAERLLLAEAQLSRMVKSSPTPAIVISARFLEDFA